jgi:hypothetical protein
VVIWGYIDESYRDDGKGLFTLASIISEGSTWSWFELAWQNCLDKKNAELASRGRKQITRYHAADCSSRLGEFEGWTTEEQIEFVKGLMKVFADHPVNSVAYTIDLSELAEEIPEPEPNAIGFAYGLLLQFLMMELGNWIASSDIYKDCRLSLIHDHCDYDSTLLECFNSTRRDPGLVRAENFATLVPMRWQDCLLLQPADLIAYENYKEGDRRIANRIRRKSLDALLRHESFGGMAKRIEREHIRELADLHGWGTGRAIASSGLKPHG